MSRILSVYTVKVRLEMLNMNYCCYNMSASATYFQMDADKILISFGFSWVWIGIISAQRVKKNFPSFLDDDDDDEMRRNKNAFVVGNVLGWMKRKKKLLIWGEENGEFFPPCVCRVASRCVCANADRSIKKEEYLIETAKVYI